VIETDSREKRSQEREEGGDSNFIRKPREDFGTTFSVVKKKNGSRRLGPTLKRSPNIQGCVRKAVEGKRAVSKRKSTRKEGMKSDERVTNRGCRENNF